MPQSMPCKLCKSEKPLRQSHIVPEFLFQTMYDDKHRFFGVGKRPSNKIDLFQKGLREPLLCEGCEQQFGRYEQYASRVFFGGTEMTVARKKHSLFLGDLDYKLLKLFFMSLLWRFGVTTLEYYKGATLGPHEEKLRGLLQVENPGPYNSYPCFVTVVTHEGKHISDLVIGPSLARIEGHWIWSVVVAGFVITYFVSSHPPSEILSPAFLKADGKMIINIAEITTINFLHEAVKNIAESQWGRIVPPSKIV